MFFSNEAFETFAKKQVGVLQPTCLECLSSVNEEIRNIAKDILFSMKELELFNQVSKEILSVLEDILVKYFNRSKDSIEIHFQV